MAIYLSDKNLSSVDKEILLIDMEKIENSTEKWAKVFNRDFKKNIPK